MCWSLLLILYAGDIERNPGPSSSDVSLLSSSSSSSQDLSPFEENFSVIHYNVQSLVSKIDQLQVELSHFDIIAFTETWLSPAIPDEDISLVNYQIPYRKDRPDSYGGVIVYVKDTIPCKRRQDLQIANLECIWLELKLKNKIILFIVFYRPPNSKQVILDNIERSIYNCYNYRRF